MLRLPSIIRKRRGRNALAGIAASLVAACAAGSAPAQTTQSVAQLVAEGYQILSFVATQGGQGYTALLVNYREATPMLLLCNLNFSAATRQMVTSSCFEVR